MKARMTRAAIAFDLFRHAKSMHLLSLLNLPE